MTSPGDDLAQMRRMGACLGERVLAPKKGIDNGYRLCAADTHHCNTAAPTRRGHGADSISKQRRRRHLNTLEIRKAEPALVVTHTDITPLAERLDNGHLGALVDGK